MSYRTCDHLKEDGVYCSSPALRDQRYCYFHLNLRARRVQAARARLHGDTAPLPDAHPRQHARRAGRHPAGGRRPRRRPHPQPSRRALALRSATGCHQPQLHARVERQRPEVEADEPLRALEVHSLQQQYDLPFDTDLDAPPDVAAAEIDATVALPLDARPGQTEQPSLARVPARPDSQSRNDIPANAGLRDHELAFPNLLRDPQARQIPS